MCNFSLKKEREEESSNQIIKQRDMNVLFVKFEIFSVFGSKDWIFMVQAI